ncbi:T9SS type A sorting domain-containing protein [Halosquirtibacter xylanolyticus]|uniref:alpha-amylase family glycosyl hydrolase n=1 Tax=Halosquirtibacter xylanolyticus TaxID=3374599 RepID=UPI003748288E|nr:T9SS type A sorting domain-containing protein [Prolixibacteraceae bacterium]
MKRIILLVLLWTSIVGAGVAENITDFSFTTVPEECTSNAPITIRFDAKNFDVESKWGGAYVWIWIDGVGNPSNQGDWSNTNDAFKMTREGTSSVYTYTFTPTTLWAGTDFSSISRIGFLVKDKSGSGKTSDLSISFAENTISVTTSPASFNSADQVTLTVDTKGQDTFDGWGNIYLWIWQEGMTGVTNPSDQGTWGDTSEKYKMEHVPGTTKYRYTFTPTELWPGIPGSLMSKLGVLFKKKDGSKSSDNFYFDVTKGGFMLDTEGLDNGQQILEGSTLSFTSTATESASLSIYIDNIKVKEVSGNTISYDFIPSGVKSGTIEIQAAKGGQVISNKFTYLSYGATVSEERPEGAIAGISYPTATSARLVLYAPNKQNVFVLGDFNTWEVSSPYQMKRDGDYYWLDINGLTSGEEYAFQYFIDGTILVADPYTDKILDPWNDQYITNETYPDLKGYPVGKTEGIVSVLQPGQTPYKWSVNDFTVPQSSKLMIYELLVRDFDSKHTYQGVLDHLDYLESLNVNVIELMPVNEFDGNSSWGYNPNFYFAPDKYYGPKNDLKRLVDECHKRGMAVVIDLVLNHSWGQSPFYLMYKNGDKPSSDNPWYNVDHNFENPDAQWGEDFNHDSEATRALVDSINSYWMSEYKIDGFRFDFTKGFSNNYKPNDSDPWGSKYDQDRIDNLERMSSEIWKRNSDALVICEHLAENAEDKVLADYGMLLWGNMNTSGYKSLEGNGGDFTGADYKTRGFSNMNLIAYMESHDEERIAYKAETYGAINGSYNTREIPTMCERLRANGALFFLIPGPKMMWQFGEVGYDYSIDENGRTGEKPIRWDYIGELNRNKVYQDYARFAELKRNDEVFSTSDYDYSLNNKGKYIRLHLNGKEVVIVGNFDVSAKGITVDIPTSGTWHNMVTKETTQLSAGNNSINLQPGEYRILSNYDPDTSTGISDKLVNSEVNVYPIPASDRLFVESKSDVISYQVYDILGNKMSFSEIKYTSNEVWNIPLNGFDSGIYFLVLEYKNKNIEKVMFIVR